MIQRSPSRWAQGGRRMARNFVPRFFRPPRIRLHLHSEGMGCVNEEIEALLGENAREPLSAAEAAGEQPARKGRGLRVLPASDRVTS